MGRSMSDQLSMFEELTSSGSASATSSLASESGAMRSDSQDGPTIASAGVGAARASRSAPQESERPTRTSATYGRIGIGSSQSAILQQSLVSRLLPRLDRAGSTMF